MLNAEIINFLENNNFKDFSSAVLSYHGLAQTTNIAIDDLRKNLKQVLLAWDTHFISSEINKYLQSQQLIGESKLVASILPGVQNGKLAEHSVQLSLNGAITLEEMFQLNDCEIIKIILHAEIYHFLYEEQTEKKPKINLDDFPDNLYKAIKDIFSENSKNTSDGSNEQQAFKYLVELIKTNHNWLKKITKVLVHNYRALSVLHEEIQLAMVKNDYCHLSNSAMFHKSIPEQIDNFSVVLAKSMTSFKNSTDRVKVFFPEVENGFEKNSNQLPRFTFGEHPLFLVHKHFIFEKKWSQPLNKKELTLVKLILSIENFMAEQLLKIYQITTIKNTKLIEKDFKAFLASKVKEGADIGSSKAITRTRSSSLTHTFPFNKKTPEVSKPIVPSRMPTRSRSRSFTKGDKFGFLNTFFKSSTTLGFNAKELGKIEELIAYESISQLEQYTQLIINFTASFEAQMKAINSYGLSQNIEKFLGDNLLIRLLKLLILTHILDPLMHLTDGKPIDTEQDEEILKYIQIIYDHVPKNTDKATWYGKPLVLTMKDVCSVKDVIIIFLLNGYSLPSTDSARHHLETKLVIFIDFIRDANPNKLNIADYNSLCFQFLYRQYGTINTHLEYCFKHIIDLWFFFNNIHCWSKKYNTTWLNESAFNRFFIKFTKQLGQLGDYRLAKRIISSLFLQFWSDSKTPLNELRNTLTFDHGSALREHMSELDTSNLQNQSFPDAQDIKKMQEFFHKINTDGIKKPAEYISVVKSILKRINALEVAQSYAKTTSAPNKLNIKNEMLESFAAISITQAQLVEEQSGLEKYLPCQEEQISGKEEDKSSDFSFA